MVRCLNIHRTSSSNSPCLWSLHPVCVRARAFNRLALTFSCLFKKNLLYGKRGDLKTFDLKGTFGSKRLVGEQDEVEVDIRSPVDQDASKVPRESDGISAESAEAGEADGTTQASDVVSPPIPTIVDAESGEKKNMVLLDNNFMQYTAGFPVPLLPKVRAAACCCARGPDTLNRAALNRLPFCSFCHPVGKRSTGDGSAA